MQLRPYQFDLKKAIYTSWDNGADNTLAVSPTGSGKTVLFSEVIKEHDGPCSAIAHRQELVLQISLALARDEVKHRIIGPKNVVTNAVRLHMEEIGKSYYVPNAHVAVAGVDTLTRRRNELAHWLKSVTLWIQDEAHHVLKSNKWGTAANMFDNARGLGVTATPTRADRKGLGRHADGLFDEMVQGPTMRALIDAGYLTDYRIFAPPSDLDLTNVGIGADGDFIRGQLKKAVRKSHIVGDVVEHYLRIAPGKRGITFVESVETATDIAREYNRRGVPALVVSAKSTDAERTSATRRLASGEILNLVNVDLFGEGFDLPAIEVVSMARATQSYALFVQQFGRALRLMISAILSGAWDTYTDAQRKAFIAESVKPTAIIIDHVGNIAGPRGHGLPDAPRVWSLDAGERGSRNGNDDAIPVTACPECTGVYERIFPSCPYCGYHPVPADRSRPEFVDGDLMELDPYTLANMRGEVDRVDMNKELYRQELQRKFVPKVGEYAHVNRHVKRQEIQQALRTSIAWWASYQRALGRDDSESYKRFYWKFGIDVLSAQALKTNDAFELANRVNNHLGELAA